MTMNKETALVVFSGGQDSTTCLFWAKKAFQESRGLEFCVRAEACEGGRVGQGHSFTGRCGLGLYGCFFRRFIGEELVDRRHHADG